ncbi:hypothetical protein Q0M94_07960 [Deinococcus radiomollis]|uniref:hypothetical protein n=1 Tax=Deinococcus radiomollis TaxID=468916 RepID=UPI003892134F
MKRLLLLAPVTAALMTACPASTPIPLPVTLASLTLSGVSGPLLIDNSAKLTVTATGSDGQTFAGTPIFTSSDANAVFVAADGTVMARHLSSTPVVITASLGAKTATINVATYGLDATGGTYSSLYKASPSTTNASAFTAAFKDSSGATLTSGSVSVAGPAAYNSGKAVSFDLSTSLGVSNFVKSVNFSPLVSGSYTASITLSGKIYTKTFILDASKALTPPSGVILTSTATTYELKGAAPTGAAGGVKAVLADQSGQFKAESAWSQTLPSGGNWNTPVVSGTYAALVISSSTLLSQTTSFPDQLNLSDYQTDNQVVPQSDREISLVLAH